MGGIGSWRGRIRTGYGLRARNTVTHELTRPVCPIHDRSPARPSYIIPP